MQVENCNYKSYTSVCIILIVKHFEIPSRIITLIYLIKLKKKPRTVAYNTFQHQL